MKIEELWCALEAESKAGCTGAWLTRFALPQPSQRLLVAFENSTNRRALLLPLPKAAIPAKREWPVCRGVEVFSIAISGEAHLGVRLLDRACVDVFSVLAKDLAPRIAVTSDACTAAKVLLARLRRWQKFLAAGVAGLPIERQRGLYGELYTLRTYLLPSLGAAVSITNWRAPLAAHQDFQFQAGALEVKTTTAKQPQSVRITSERQLDDSGIPALFLHIVVLDEREIDGQKPSHGETLPDIVNSLRVLVQSDERVSETFEDRLLEAGYLDNDAPRYETRRFAIRGELTFHVKSGFPRLVERDLPIGIGDVAYMLSIAACEAFALPIARVIEVLAMADNKGRGGNE